MTAMQQARTCLGILGAMLLAGGLHAAPIQVTVDTSLLAGSTIDLAFDLTDGGPPDNTVTITGFTTDGSLDAAAIVTQGQVTGTLPGTVQLADTLGFSEYLQGIVLGSSLQFIFDTTGKIADPGSFPDAFAFFLLDAGLPIPTSDPTGANALFLYNIGDAAPLQVYASDAVTVRAVDVTNGAPEPGVAALAIAALLALGVVRKVRR